MAYDPHKDVEIARYDLGDLVITIQQYNGGERKLQISRRFGEDRIGRAGRLSRQEFEDIITVSDDLLKFLLSDNSKAKTKNKKKTRNKKK